MAAGAVGMLGSFAITDEKLKLLQNPHYVPSCSLNPVISCGSVMKSAQASAFGFPNSWVGLAAFAAVVVVGASLLAGARFANWYWRLFNIGSFLGVVFVHWLFVQSVFFIHALCPWCIVVWSVTIPIFWYTTLRNLREGVIPTPAPLRGSVRFVQDYKNVILVLWYLAIAGTILAKFWYYFKTVL